MAIKKYNVLTSQWEYITPTKSEFDAHAGQVATTAVLGHVMVDGVTIKVDGEGRISAVIPEGGGEGTPVLDATTLVKGIVQLSNEIDLESEVLAATPKAVKDALAAAKSFTTEQIADLVGSAPETLDTLQELAMAAQEADTALEGLISLVAGKATTEALTAHTDNAEIHVTQAQKDQWNAAAIHVGELAPANTELLWIGPLA